MTVNRDLFAELEGIGEKEVRRRVAAGKMGLSGSAHRDNVEYWLESKVQERADASASKRDAHDEETLSISRRALAISENALSIAKDANRIASEDLSIASDNAKSARRNARWAMYAAITAVVAAIIAAKDQIFALIAGIP